MAKAFTILAFVLVLSSCRKRDTTMEPASTFTFTANGATYTWNGTMTANSEQGSMISKTIDRGASIYKFSARSAVNTILFQMQSPKLSITTYGKTATGWPDNFPDQIQLQSNNYYMNKTGDFATIVISKIETLLATGDRYASGSFTTMMSRDSASTRVNITNGVFKNVRIVE